MTAAEQRTTDLFPHQNGRQSPATISCVSSNVGSITDFLFSSSTHSTLPTCSDIPSSNEIHEQPSNEVPPPSSPPPPPQILIHTSSEQCINMNQQSSGNINQISVSENDNEPSSAGNKEKLGHRRVDETGIVTYKRVIVDDLMKSLQLGFTYVLGKHHHPQRQVLLQDFQQIEYQDFPPEGSKSTPVHPYAGFRLKTYAQTAFRFFRNAFGVDPSSFMSSLCAKDLRELPNPGASGSIFYITADDTYIIKTVSKKEARFLLSLLPGYYMNLTQNPFTLLPKFFGLYCYQSANKNIRFVIMNNLIPTNVKLHEKYDLKGSIYKRKASEEERKRELPTLKDNDFKSLHPHGLIIEPFFYDQLIQTIEDDVRVLGSFDIMDYSLLLAVHNITEEMKPTQNLSLLSPSLSSSPTTSKPISSLDMITNTPSSIHEDIRTTISTDSGIAMTTIHKIPTYIQYIRVIEFVRAQQEPLLRTPSILNTENSLSDNPIPNDNNETASTKTVRPDLSPILNRNINQTNDNQSTIQRNSKNPINHNDTSSPFHVGNSLIGGDVWYNRQNLSRLAMAGIPAVNQNGDLLLLYVGIIDILQNYRLRKKLEHAFKSTLVTREEISVCNPSHYGDRFVRFLSHRPEFDPSFISSSSSLSQSRSQSQFRLSSLFTWLFKQYRSFYRYCYVHLHDLILSSLFGYLTLNEKLYVAIHENDLYKARKLLSHGASPSFLPADYKSIFTHLIKNNNEIQNYYIETSLFSSILANDSMLYMAVSNDNFNLVKELIHYHDYGQIGQHTEVVSLCLAVKRGYSTIVEYLIDYGHINPNDRVQLGCKHCKSDTDDMQRYQFPLYHACRENHLKLVKYLIKSKHCDINQLTTSCETCLHGAILGATENCFDTSFNNQERYFIVQYLLTRPDCNPNLGMITFLI
ncbi:unnamed protein product [Rotaria sordida]|uniref:PIPK domain-containing protein n=1 Tax=Rotaria sordida TaxID=392033 RepID=A0A814SIR5_9BILA|nr:unnamed protein product [Rotaria sordida]